MLPKRYRLPIQLFIGKKGQLRKNPCFLLKIFPAEIGFSRFGVTVSAKTAKRAAERNRLKRAAFNFVKEKLKDLAVADYWLSILPPAADLPKEEFMEQLEKVLK